MLARLKCLLFLLAALGCESPVEPPSAVPDSAISWSYVAVGRDGDRIRVRGFDSAAPAQSSVQVYSNGALQGEAEADARGRFDLRCAGGDSVELRVRAPGWEAHEALDFAVHDMAVARAEAVRSRLTQTGAVPNHLLLPSAFAGEEALLLLVNSGDNTVDNLSLSSGSRQYPPLSLPERDGPLGRATAQPFAIEAVGEQAVVTRLGQGGVTLFDIQSGAVLAEVDERAARPLSQPFVPSTPVDGDGDGSPEASVNALLPRTLEGLAVLGDRLFVCAANLLRAGVPPIYAPGMVLVYEIGDGTLAPATPDHLFTEFFNPQVAVAAGGLVAVVETGVLELGAGGWQTSSDGGVELFDALTLERVAAVSLGRSAPGSAALSADGQHLYVGSLLRPELYKIEVASATLLRGPQTPITLFASAEVQSIFSLVAHPSGLVFASSFNTDQVYAIDGLDDAVSPWPFAEPFAVGEGGQAFAGAHALALRHGRNGVDFRGPDFAVLMSLAARVATIDTRYVMGP